MKIEGPYNDSVEILQTQLKILSESKFNQEELSFFLYQNILPQVQHQYNIYSTIVVIIDFFEKYIKGKSHDECMDILDLHNTHTNTLLYCGVLLYRMSIKQVIYFPTIYDCYSFNAAAR